MCPPRPVLILQLTRPSAKWSGCCDRLHWSGHRHGSPSADPCWTASPKPQSPGSRRSYCRGPPCRHRTTLSWTSPMSFHCTAGGPLNIATLGTRHKAPDAPWCPCTWPSVHHRPHSGTTCGSACRRPTNTLGMGNCGGCHHPSLNNSYQCLCKEALSICGTCTLLTGPTGTEAYATWCKHTQRWWWCRPLRVVWMIAVFINLARSAWFGLNVWNRPAEPRMLQHMPMLGRNGPSFSISSSTSLQLSHCFCRAIRNGTASQSL